MIISKEFEWYGDNYLVEAEVNMHYTDIELDYYTIFDREGRDITYTIFPSMEEEIMDWLENYEYGE